MPLSSQPPVHLRRPLLSDPLAQLAVDCLDDLLVLLLREGAEVVHLEAAQPLHGKPDQNGEIEIIGGGLDGLPLLADRDPDRLEEPRILG